MPETVAVVSDPDARSPRDQLVDRVLDWAGQHGIGDVSLRGLATAVGTSHRMLNYHFGSREGVLSAMVAEICRRQQRRLGELVAELDDPYEAADTYWHQLADSVTRFAPIFFELSAAAMHGRPWAAELRVWSTSWTDGFATLFARAGHVGDEADDVARMAVAMTRGLLFDLALTGDRAAVDRAMRRFIDSTRPRG